MEASKTGPSNADFALNGFDSRSVLPNKKNESDQSKLNEILRSCSIEVAGDWLDATNGEFITPKEFQNLYEAGYASVSSIEIDNLFSGWEEFYRVSTEQYVTPEEKEEDLWRKVEALRIEAENGNIPIELFLDIKNVPTHKNKHGRMLNDKEFTNKYASLREIYKRYHKYLLVDHLLKDSSDAQEVSEERKISIAVGFTIKTGKPLSSLTAALKNSRSDLQDQDVNLAMEELGFYEYINYGSRGDHLKTILAIGRPSELPKPEYYYDPAKQTMVMLGATALNGFSLGDEKEYLYWLESRQQVEFSSRNNFIYKKVKSNEILNLNELLTNVDIIVERNNDQRNKYNNLSRNLYRSYGQLIISITGDLNGYLIDRTRTLQNQE
jgi:hypothetical protein